MADNNKPGLIGRLWTWVKTPAFLMLAGAFALGIIFWGGFNTALQPQTSRQLELGAKWRAGEWQADATLFRADVSHEISVMTNSGGRSSYQNVGSTLRQGLEVSGAWRPASAWRAAAALTWLDATYQDTFLTCAGTPCTTPTASVAAGSGSPSTSRSGSAERTGTAMLSGPVRNTAARFDALKISSRTRSKSDTL